MMLKCSSCQAINTEDTLFCHECGLPLTTQETTPGMSLESEKVKPFETKTILNYEKGHSVLFKVY